VILKSIEFANIIGNNTIILDREIEMIYRYVRDCYHNKFPELE